MTNLSLRLPRRRPGPPVKYDAAFIARIKELQARGRKLCDIDLDLRVPMGTAGRVLRAAEGRSAANGRKLIWNPTRWAKAQRMRADGLGDGEIAAAMGLTEKQVSDKFTNSGFRPRKAERVMDERPLLDDRARRAEAARMQSLTGFIFGDPPPGFSALDRRGQRS